MGKWEPSGTGTQERRVASVVEDMAGPQKRGTGGPPVLRKPPQRPQVVARLVEAAAAERQRPLGAGLDDLRRAGLEAPPAQAGVVEAEVVRRPVEQHVARRLRADDPVV